MASPRQAAGRGGKAAAFMRKAIQYYEAGDLARAHKNVTKYLSADPVNADANHLAGVIANADGRPKTAIPFFLRAIKANPRIAMVHNNLGEAYRALKQFEDAEAAYRSAMALAPKESGFQNNLGTALLGQGRAEDAVAVYETALKLSARDAMLLTNYGNALLEVGRGADAVAAHMRALEIQPSLLEALNNLGLALLGSGDHLKAEEKFRLVLARDPAHHGALGALATIASTRGDIDAASELHEARLRQAPEDREAYLDYADMLRYANRPEAAAAVIERHLVIDPECMDSHVQLASIWRAAGERIKAEALLREALKRDPEHVAARMVLSQIAKHTAEDENLAALKKLAADETLPESKMANVQFGLGKAFEDIAEYDGAGRAFVAANYYRRAEIKYDEAQFLQTVAKLKETFSQDILSARSGEGSGETTPIFIVGMPRSGTSLVEQIISSHSRVDGAGELTTFSDVVSQAMATRGGSFPGDVPTLANTQLVEIGDKYVAAVRKRFGDAPHITDKMPHNFLNVGMIRLALPNAKIIHCCRHPMDTSLSIFKHAFSAAHDYAYEMGELGRYYREYLSLMAHWREVCGDAMHDIQYETLVEDTEAQARALIEFCGLAWEPACLEFYKTKRTVNTISASQVRQPIYKSSVALWKRYGDHLQPLIDALGDAVPPEA